MYKAMYKTVFVSHSRDDPNLAFFQKIFAALPIESIWMEFENIESPPYSSIRENVNRSDALFVLLSKHLCDKQHTNNWVSFEVGLAANRERTASNQEGNQKSFGLDIYVFEPLDDSVNFAVPYFTHYMRYRPTLKALKLLKDKLKDGSIFSYGVPLICPWSDCLIQFDYLSRFYTDSYFCPACRREVHFLKSYKDFNTGKDRRSIRGAVKRFLREKGKDITQYRKEEIAELTEGVMGVLRGKSKDILSDQ